MPRLSRAVPDRPNITMPVLLGGAALLGFFGLFGGWAATAPLSSAAIAPGVVMVESSRKAVQHLEGGIVRDILVAEGARVAAGQVVMRLETAQAGAAFNAVKGQRDALKAAEARLLAERDGQAILGFPPDLEAAARTDPALAAGLDGQRRIFEARRTSLEGQRAILEERIAQSKAQMAGHRAQVESSRRQLELTRTETADAETLYRAGLDRKPRLLQLQRQEAALRGAIGEIEGQIAQAGQQIGETRLRILDLSNARRDSAAQELREVQTRLADMESRGDAARDVLDRREVTAPVTGTVVNLKVFTAGGVVAPGAVLMEIVPAEDRLVIEARVKPTDIDVVRAGLGAQVRLSAYKQRTTPVLDGQVTRVSADRLVDERTAQDYYTARIEVDRAELARLPEIRLSAGMPVEVMVITGERTLLNYLLRPLKDSFARAFREE